MWNGPQNCPTEGQEAGILIHPILISLWVQVTVGGINSLTPLRSVHAEQTSTASEQAHGLGSGGPLLRELKEGLVTCISELRGTPRVGHSRKLTMGRVKGVFM